ncbi:cobalt transporter CbiM [Desulfococcaceae bacterium HSG8]|nr:cobalt transporter CbiM [Desulfococcaceae bacterium HSG8]
MHISEGVLSGPVLISGIAIAVAGTSIGLRKLDYERIAQASLLSAAFFVASLIHVPVGPSSIHLILNGIVGLLLGWAAFPTILIALMLQAVFFQFGGITTLGVNTIIMAMPAVLCYSLFGSFIGRKPAVSLTAAFACGFFSVFFGAITAGGALMFTEEGFLKVSAMLIMAHLPVMIIEGIITAFCVGFLQKVHPVMLPEFSRGKAYERQKFVNRSGVVNASE